jgi:hypothetical protein
MTECDIFAREKFEMSESFAVIFCTLINITKIQKIDIQILESVFIVSVYSKVGKFRSEISLKIEVSKILQYI